MKLSSSVPSSMQVASRRALNCHTCKHTNSQSQVEHSDSIAYQQMLKVMQIDFAKKCASVLGSVMILPLAGLGRTVLECCSTTFL